MSYVRYDQGGIRAAFPERSASRSRCTVAPRVHCDEARGGGGTLGGTPVIIVITVVTSCSVDVRPSGLLVLASLREIAAY